MDHLVPAMADSAPIKPGQRRGANAFGQSFIVKVGSFSVSERGKWVCLVEPHADPLFIAESEFSELLPDRPGGP
jgi:hypothetical protein